MAKSTGALQETPYRAGSLVCSDPTYPADGNVGSQFGMQALATQCGYTDWHAIDQYFYTGAVVAGAAPPAPVTSYATGTGSISFTFRSLVGSYQVAWQYVLEKRTSDSWHVIYRRGWSPASRTVPTSFSYSTSGCTKYRVKAVNPSGSSVYSAFNGGTQICSG